MSTFTELQTTAKTKLASLGTTHKFSSFGAAAKWVRKHFADVDLDKRESSNDTHGAAWNIFAGGEHIGDIVSASDSHAPDFGVRLNEHAGWKINE
jgi:hypothetical protein